MDRLHGPRHRQTHRQIPRRRRARRRRRRHRRPPGVAAGIPPPNSPLTMPLYKAAPALATGNCIIIKPSEDTSLVAIRLAEMFLEAGLPEGVFNVVTGYGETAGAALANHHGV